MAVKKLTKLQIEAHRDHLGGHERQVIDHAARLSALSFLISQSVEGPHEWDLSINTALAVMIEESGDALKEAFYGAMAIANLKEAANG